MKKGIFKAHVQFQDKEDGPVKEGVFIKALLLDRDLTCLEQVQVKSSIEQDLKNIATARGSSITNTISIYSFVEPVKLPIYGNCLVQVRLPYCLHLPQDFSFRTVTKKGTSCLIILNKQWTLAAAKSSLSDLYTIDSSTFFKNASLTTPKYPLDPLAGWDPVCEAINSEKLEDKNGTYRYSRVTILMDTQIKDEALLEKDISDFHGMLHDECLDTLNRFLDIYKYVASRTYIERLNKLSIENVYFYAINSGYYPAPLNIGTAEINLSQEEIQKIEEMAKSDREPPLHALLLLQAEGSLKHGSNLLALVESYKALDVFLEQFLYRGYRRLGLSDIAIDTKLESCLNTKQRLQKLVKEVKKQSFSEMDPRVWNEWHPLYKDRNKTIHAGLNPDLQTTTNILSLNKKIIEVLEISDEH